MQKSKMGNGCCGFLMLLVLFSAVFSLRGFAEPLDNWHLRSPLSQVSTLNGVVYGNNTFVAVSGGTILTSPDGDLWTGSPSGCSIEISGVTYGNGTFVAIGENGTILTSSDGIS